MPRTTENLALTVPESGDVDYHETLDEFIHQLDRLVVLRGLLANRPTPGVAGRLYIATDETPPTFYYDDGDEWVSPSTFGDPPPELTRTDRNEIIEVAWRFDEPIRGDILGRAAEADVADFAIVANNANMLDDHRAADFARTDHDETLDGRYTFDAGAVMDAGVRVNGGVVGLPNYTGADPSNRREGDMWFRPDAQP